jgi:hypothetical protein
MVDDMKVAIRKRKEPELDHLAADALHLWKVSESPRRMGEDTSFPNIRSRHRHPEGIPGCVESDPFHQLSQDFSSPPRMHLHIIVQLPPAGEYLR